MAADPEIGKGPGNPSFEADACAKAILCGEHAVVFGRPALAVPLPTIRARAALKAGNPRGRGILVEAPDLGKAGFPDQDPALSPLAASVEFVFSIAKIPTPALTLRIESAIPPSRGLGSGAAVAVSTARAAAAAAGIALSRSDLSAVAFEVEKIHHGSPSGIDNTVIAFERPILFSTGGGMRFVKSAPLELVLSQTGRREPTSAMVRKVRESAANDPLLLESIFDSMADASAMAERGLETGDRAGLGYAMNAAQELLARLGVSCPELDSLVRAARSAGALGAKLCGAGGGGFVVALPPSPESAPAIAAALEAAGGKDTFCCPIGRTVR